MRKYFKTIILLAAVLILPKLTASTVLADECQFEIQLEQVFCLENNRRSVSARKIFDKLNMEKEIYHAWQRGAAAMTGSGSTEVFCRNVLLLEWLRAKRIKSTQKFLDYLYLGDWRSIAALEGNKYALYELGEYYLDIAQRTSKNKHSFAKGQVYTEAYRFFSAAANQRSAKGYISLSLVRVRLSELGVHLTTIKPINFVAILCPVRVR